MKNSFFKFKILSIKTFSSFLFVIIIFTVYGCSMLKKSTKSDNDNAKKQPGILIHAGVSSGGLVDNMKMVEIKGVSEVDAISGATNMQFNAGIHSEINIKHNKIETGLDYISFDQSVEYEMPSFSVTGNRNFKFHQFRLPLTYNFQFLKSNNSYPKLILKAGLSYGYTFSQSITGDVNIPDYKFTNWDIGPTIGISYYPLQIKQNYRIGIYFDMYRGSRIYDDIYHEAKGIGSQSFMKFGVILQPLSFKN